MCGTLVPDAEALTSVFDAPFVLAAVWAIHIAKSLLGVELELAGFVEAAALRAL